MEMGGFRRFDRLHPEYRIKQDHQDLSFGLTQFSKESEDFESIEFVIDEEVIAGIQALSSATEASVFQVVFACYQLTLSGLSNQDSFVSGLVSTLRSKGEHQTLVGPLFNILPIKFEGLNNTRWSCSPSNTFSA